MSNRKYIVMGMPAALAGYLLFRWGRARRGDTSAPPTSAENTLIDDVLPTYEFRDTISATIRATPEQIFRALYEVTLTDMPLANALGRLRYLPGQLTGRLPDTSTDDMPFMQILADQGTIVVAEEPNREIVTGTIGKFHDPINQQIVPLQTADEFYHFDDPAYQKLVMSIRVREAETVGEHWVELEHRTHALSQSARRKFALYWLVIKPGGAFATKLLLNAVKRRAEAATPAIVPEMAPA